MHRIARARLNALMRETLAELLERRVRDPRVERITLTSVQVSQDVSVAKVFYSMLGGEEERRTAQRGLENAARFLRGEIGRLLHMRNSPQLHFHFDTSLEKGQRVEELLREWHEEKPNGPDAEGHDEEDAHG